MDSAGAALSDKDFKMRMAAVGGAPTTPINPEKAEGPGPDHDGDADDVSVLAPVQAAPAPGLEDYRRQDGLRHNTSMRKARPLIRAFRFCGGSRGLLDMRPFLCKIAMVECWRTALCLPAPAGRGRLRAMPWITVVTEPPPVYAHRYRGPVIDRKSVV